MADVTRPSRVVEGIKGKNIRVLNVAGDQEPKSPGIGKRVERFLKDVFRRLAREGMVNADEG